MESPSLGRSEAHLPQKDAAKPLVPVLLHEIEFVGARRIARDELVALHRGSDSIPVIDAPPCAVELGGQREAHLNLNRSIPEVAQHELAAVPTDESPAFADL